MRWYYVVNGEVVGPVRTRYLSRILKQGLIDNKTYVYNKHVLKDWTRIKYVLDLIKDLTSKSEKEKDKSEAHRKRTRKYHREKAKRKHREKESTKVHFQSSRKKEKVKTEDSEFEEPFDISDGSSSDEELTTNTFSLAPPSISDQISEQIPVKNGDWIETLSGEKGRVLYIGLVDGFPGEAVGIELTKPEGDCDGSHEGRRYFQCKKNHGQFILRRFIKNVILDPEYIQVSPYQSVVEDLNLNLDFDVVSFQLAVATLGFTWTPDEISDVWELWNSASHQQCMTPVDKLEVLINMLDSSSETT